MKATINPVPVAAHLLRITARNRVDHPTLRDIRDRLLDACVRHAAARVPHYRDALTGELPSRPLRAEDLRHLPILERETLNANQTSGRLFADGFGPHNTVSHATSGSSGIPVVIHNSRRDLGYLRATYLHDMTATGLRLTDRIAYFRPSPFSRHPFERLGLLPLAQIDTCASIATQADAFLQARPTYVTGFPHTILAVVDELRRRGVRPSGVHDVMFGGERLSPSAKAHILQFFGARGHEVYASVETFTIARSCRLGSLHVRTGDVLVEIEQPDGSVLVEDGEGDILVTRLRSEAMPLLRYRLGDRVRIEPNHCPCGESATPVVTHVLGRRQDVIYDTEGRPLSADVVDVPLVSLPQVRQLQVEQFRPGALEVRIVPATGDASDVLSRARQALAHALPTFTITVRLVTEIQPGANGKVQLVRRHVQSSTKPRNTPNPMKESTP